MSGDDLIARLEKATGPDRQLDLAIHTAIFGQPSEDNLDELLAPEAYTGSVDAALMLVPEGLDWHIAAQIDVGASRATIRYFYANVGSSQVHWANTPALAICIAAMKARAACP